jgi:zinc transporter
MHESLRLRTADAAEGPAEVTWVDVDASDDAGARWLMNESGLGDEVTSRLLHPGRSTRRENLDQGLFVSLCGIHPAGDGSGEDAIAVGLLLEDDRVVSVRFQTIEAIEDVRRRVRAGTGPRTPLEFLAMAVVGVRRRLEALVTRISEDVAELEDSVLGDSVQPDIEALSGLRREIFRVRRYLGSFDALLKLIVSDPTLAVNPDERRALDGASEFLSRYVSALEDCRERTMLLHDLLESRASHTMARATYNLTIVATVFLPLTFVTGLLGMNVAGIPESHAPWGFWIVVAALALLATVSWVLLHWNRWLLRPDGSVAGSRSRGEGPAPTGRRRISPPGST